MTRRTLLALSGPAGALRLAGQTYSGVAYRNYSRCVPDHLKQIALAAYQRRAAELKKLTTPEQIGERKQWARETFWKLTGGAPERTPLNARSTGKFDRGVYRVENWIYESQAGLPVTANLYVPNRGRGPFPAVLLQMGHSPIGKAYATYQRFAQGLVQLGFVVLGFDPMGQGERIYYPDSSGRATRLSSVDEEHSLAGRQMLLTGDTCTRFQTWDAVRSLDFLLSLPFVDPRYVATTGQSGGGTNSMMLAAVDDRITCAALASANTENFICADYDAPGSTDDAEQNIVFGAPAGFDRWDMIYPFAPKPILISVSDKDFFGTYGPQYISSGREEFQHLKSIYSVLGKADHLQWASTPLPHSLEYDSRLQIYNWFLRWMQPGSKPVSEEPPTRPEEPDTLLCTKSGSVIHSLQSETPHTLGKKRLGTPSPIPLERLLNLQPGTPGPLKSLKSTVGQGVMIDAVEVATAPGVYVPAWLFQPRPVQSKKPLLILLHSAGRNVEWHESETCQTLARQGFTVCAPDLRGIGDLMPEMTRGNPRYARWHNEEEAYAWASLMLGRPLLSQRVTDLLAVVRSLKQHEGMGGRPIMVAAQGRHSVTAQFAAALSPDISRIYLSGGLVSFRSVVETENYNHPLSNFIPGILKHTDLPEITASAGVRKMVLGGMVDGAGRRLNSAAVRTAYAQVRNLEVREQSGWSAEVLSAAALS